MKKDELLMTLLLASVLIAGSAFQFFRGGDKTAEVIFVNGDHTPFESIEFITPTPALNTIDAQSNPFPTPLAIISQPQVNNQQVAVAQWLNRASLDDLQGIPGIGEHTANNIVTYRKENNGFKTAEQLTNVPGIGEKRLQDICLYIEKQLRNSSNASSNGQIEKKSTMQSNSSNAQPVSSINRATLAQLQAVSGIGPNLAQMILAERAKHRNGFENWNQLRAVSGVGDARIKLLQQHFTLE